MNKTEFDLLCDKYQKNEISNEELSELSQYKVDNAIIMAAGYSSRCMPLSNVLPKGLFEIKGEVLIEREIKQLIEAGIDEIIVVTGFMNEKFDYLKEKYGVILVHNPDFDKYNNMSSLYYAQDYMKNSYILCADNYYEKNVFCKYLYESHYSCVYSDKYCDEYCVIGTDEEGFITSIHRGGEKSWYTIGDAYFDNEFSSKFKNFMNKEWDKEETRNMLMDDFHIRHIDQLKLKEKDREDNCIYEFDTLEEIVEFDPGFKEYAISMMDKENNVVNVFSKYFNVKAYHSVPTEQLSGRLHLNENLFKPSPKCLEVLKNITIEDIYLYDLSSKDEFISTLSKDLRIPEINIFAHNGSAEVIKAMFTIILNENDVVLVPDPGWSYYKSVVDVSLAKCVKYNVLEGQDSYEYDIQDIKEKASQYKPKIIVLTSPQMPTGCVLSNEDIEGIIKDNPNSIILLDEAYWGYGDDSNDFERRIIKEYNNVVISRTFSKFFGLANIRIGYGLCSYPLRRTIGLDLPLFRENGISRKIAIEAIKDKEYYHTMKKESNKVRDWFIDEINKMPGAKAYKSASNFVFIKLEKADAEDVRKFMEENHILIRLFTDKSELRLRITVAPKDVMERVLFQLERAIKAAEMK